MTDENSAEVIGFNLFGDPVYDRKDKRGRPSFEWTKENSNKVSMLLAMGWTNDRIASVVVDPRTGKSISTPTLKRYFRSELKVREVARDMLMARRLMLAMEKSEDGNVGAMRILGNLIEQNDAMLADMRFKGDGETKADEAKKVPKLGKKEAARAAAEQAVSGGDQSLWGGDLTPGFKSRPN
ncbi:helix-turn-helix domain containing protein [Celeribacter ethanolicus]|uniref:Helix-turn-helix domain containing protein n=1 Tax=Celeribacter ethanolicus TaxID=1758178 RepID=A0A291GBS3_9RHOB|nr:helix-turn-helix domain containing protein [Celeribacter ethanolicus]ATG47607.1 helix-turn-helix domain containing protein [Celeribacter ethanolicus]